MTNLHETLAGIAHGAATAADHGDRPALPVRDMRAAARRRRAAYSTGVGTVAAATTAALAVGGTSLAGLGGHGASPAGAQDWAVDYAECGTTRVLDPVEDGAAVTVMGDTPADSDAVVTVRTVAKPAGEDLTRVATVHSGVALDADGTVVGVLGVPVGGEELVDAGAEARVTTTSAPLFSCGAHDGVTRLGPGDYALLVGRTVEVSGGADLREARPLGTSMVVVPAPAGDTAGDGAARAATLLPGAPPACGQPAPSLVDGADAASGVSVAVAPMPTASGVTIVPAPGDAEPAADVTMTRLGDDLEVADGGIQALITSGGEVVGTANGLAPHSPGFTFTGGTTRVLPGVSLNQSCTGLRLLPGVDYELWVYLPLANGAGSWVAGPWPVTASGVGAA